MPELATALLGSSHGVASLATVLGEHGVEQHGGRAGGAALGAAPEAHRPVLPSLVRQLKVRDPPPASLRALLCSRRLLCPSPGVVRARRAREALRQCLPDSLRNTTFGPALKDDVTVKKWLHQLLQNIDPQTQGA